MISLISLLKQTIIEGGNIFGTTSPIKKEYIPPTIKKFSSELSRLFPQVTFNFSLLGSVGKKDESGDIDLGFSISHFFTKDGKPLLDHWGIDPNEFNQTYEAYKKRSRTASESQLKLSAMLKIISTYIDTHSNQFNIDSKAVTSGSLFFEFPQFDDNGKIEGKAVQIDINIGDLDWLNFSYYSNVYSGNVKGLHRTQLVISMFVNIGKIFKHGTGVIDKSTGEQIASTPEEAIQILNNEYNLNLNKEIISDYFKLMDALKSSLPTEELNKIFNIYLKILDSTRADIPEDLQDYWIQNQETLGLKGKFLPPNSNLIKYQKL